MTIIERGSFQLLNEIEQDFDVFQSSRLNQILEVQIRSRKVVSCVSVFINVHLVCCWQTRIWQFIYAHMILFRRLRLSIEGIEHRCSYLRPGRII